MELTDCRPQGQSARDVLFLPSAATRGSAGPGDPGAGGRGELRDQAGAGGGEAAVQHGQRESGEGAGYHQRAAAAEGEAAAAATVFNLLTFAPEAAHCSRRWKDFSVLSGGFQHVTI